MSYLDIPRIHFAGSFTADPGTINNDLANYTRAVIPKAAQAWNPSGTNYFLLQSCTIAGAVLDASGTLKTAAADDPLIGGTVELSTNVDAQPKLVDLDPEWQVSSQIWGMKLVIKFGTEQVEGTLDTATLRDLWFGRAPTGKALAVAGGGFQSALRNLTFAPFGPSASSIFEKWKRAGLISIRLVTYAYDVASHQGRVVGTAGPGTATEPTQFLNARRLEPPASPPALGPRVYQGLYGAAPFLVDTARKRLVIDLGNAIPEAAPAGARQALGTMTARVVPAKGAATDIGTLDYSKAHYETTAGVEELPLTDPQITALRSAPLEIFVDGLKGKPVILAERPTGTNLELADTVVRLNPGESRTIDVQATVFGAPKKGQVVNARLFSGGARTTAGLKFSVIGGKTDANGRVQVKLTGDDPGKVRLGGALDGQIYFVDLDWGKAAPKSAPDWRARIIVRVFDPRAAVAKPTWADVKDIFEQYSRLYPFMKAFVDMSSETDVKAKVAAIRKTLTYPETHPRFMPVTRDLSRDKRDLIVRWIDAGAP
jgi:hypothetical protein